MKMEKTLNGTIGTYFEQNWQLFAPDPVTVTQAVLVFCLSERQWNDLVEVEPEAELPEKGWHKISRALWKGGLNKIASAPTTALLGHGPMQPVTSYQPVKPTKPGMNHVDEP